MSNISGNSVTCWLLSLRSGEREATECLWDRYYQRLITIAKQQVGAVRSGVADQEDIVVSVFDTLFRGIEEGRFSQLIDRSDLWCLLVAITKQKASDLKRYEGRQKRGGGDVRCESQVNGASSASFTLDMLCADDPTPDFLAELNEHHIRLMGLLRDDVLRQIANWIMEGYTVHQVSDRLGVSVRTVQRKLMLIRETWSQDIQVGGTIP